MSWPLFWPFTISCERVRDEERIKKGSASNWFSAVFVDNVNLAWTCHIMSWLLSATHHPHILLLRIIGTGESTVLSSDWLSRLVIFPTSRDSIGMRCSNEAGGVVEKEHLTLFCPGWRVSIHPQLHRVFNIYSIEHVKNISVVQFGSVQSIQSQLAFPHWEFICISNRLLFWSPSALRSYCSLHSSKSVSSVLKFVFGEQLVRWVV